MSKLYFKYGTMNSGKTTHLLQTYHNYIEIGKKAVITKPFIDKKGGNKIQSRVGLEKECDFIIENENSIIEYIKKNKQIDCILIDEAQFLSKKEVDSCLKIVIEYDIPIICYGLRTDFQINLFTGSERLLAIADKIEEIKTICKCGKKSTFVLRYINNKVIFEGNQIEIDNKSEVKYVSVCAKCYFNEKEKIK